MIQKSIHGSFVSAPPSATSHSPHQLREPRVSWYQCVLGMRYLKEASIHKVIRPKLSVYHGNPCWGVRERRLTGTREVADRQHLARGRTCRPGDPAAGPQPRWTRRSPQRPNQFSSMQVNELRTQQGLAWYPMIGDRSPRPSLLGIRLMREGSGGVSCPERVSIPTWMREGPSPDRHHPGKIMCPRADTYQWDPCPDLIFHTSKDAPSR